MELNQLEARQILYDLAFRVFQPKSFINCIFLKLVTQCSVILKLIIKLNKPSKLNRWQVWGKCMKYFNFCVNKVLSNSLIEKHSFHPAVGFRNKPKNMDKINRSRIGFPS